MGDVSTWSPGLTDTTEGSPITQVAWHYLWLGIIPVVSLLGNLTVVVTVVRTTELRQMFYFFLASLSTLHILQVLLVVPLAIARIVLGEFPLDAAWCNAWQVLQVALLGSTLVHLWLAVFDCSFLVRFPLRHKRCQTTGYVVIQMTSAWILSFILTGPFIASITRKDHDTDFPYHKGCNLALPNNILGAFLPIFFVPLAMLVVLYLVTVYMFHRKANVASAMQDGQLMNGSAPLTNGSVPAETKSVLAKKTSESAFLDTIEVLSEETSKRGSKRPNGIVRQYSICQDEQYTSILPQKQSTDDSQDDSNLEQVVTTAEVHNDSLKNLQYISGVEEENQVQHDSSGNPFPKQAGTCEENGDHNNVNVINEMNKNSEPLVENRLVKSDSDASQLSSRTITSDIESDDGAMPKVDHMRNNYPDHNFNSKRQTNEEMMQDQTIEGPYICNTQSTNTENHPEAETDNVNTQAHVADGPSIAEAQVTSDKVSSYNKDTSKTSDGEGKEGNYGAVLHSKCPNGREQLNEPLDEDHIQITMETKGLLVDQLSESGVDNPAFDIDSEDENPLAESIKVKRPKQTNDDEPKQTDEEKNETEVKDEDGDKQESLPNGHAGMVSNQHSRNSSADYGGPITPCRSILRRGGSTRPSRKSVKFASIVTDNEGKTNRGPRLKRKGSKAKPNKLTVQNGVVATNNKANKQNGSILSNSALEYLVKARQNQGERLSMRMQTHKGYLKALFAVFVCYFLLVSPFVTVFTVFGACWSCRPYIHDLVVLVTEWLMYASTMVYPFVYLVMCPGFRRACLCRAHKLTGPSEGEDIVPNGDVDVAKGDGGVSKQANGTVIKSSSH